jgi:hypothetical protein
MYDGGIMPTPHSCHNASTATDQIDFFAALLQLVTTAPPPSLVAQLLGGKGEVMAEELGSWFCVLMMVFTMNLY